jgi:hypothetical protein
MEHVKKQQPKLAYHIEVTFAEPDKEHYIEPSHEW